MFDKNIAEEMSSKDLDRLTSLIRHYESHSWNNKHKIKYPTGDEVYEDIDKGRYSNLYGLVSAMREESHTHSWDNKHNEIYPSDEEIYENIDTTYKAKTESKGIVGRFSSTETFAVLMHEVGITNSSSIKPIIGSYGAGPCIIIAIWNSKTKEAVLAHVDFCTTFSSVEALFRRVSSDDNDNLEVHLHGGDSRSEKLAMKIVELIDSKKNAKLVSKNLCTDNSPKSLAIDSRTGNIFTIFSVKQLDHGSDFSDRPMVKIALTKTPLTLCFDGTKTTLKEENNKQISI